MAQGGGHSCKTAHIRKPFTRFSHQLQRTTDHPPLPPQTHKKKKRLSRECPRKVNWLPIPKLNLITKPMDTVLKIFTYIPLWLYKNTCYYLTSKPWSGLAFLGDKSWVSDTSKILQSAWCGQTWHIQLILLQATFSLGGNSFPFFPPTNLRLHLCCLVKWFNLHNQWSHSVMINFIAGNGYTWMRIKHVGSVKKV